MNEGLLEAAERALPILENYFDSELAFWCDRDEALELDYATLHDSVIDHIADLSNLIARMREEIERTQARKQLDAAIKAIGAVPLTPESSFRPAVDPRAHVAKRIRGGAHNHYRFKAYGDGLLVRLQFLDELGGES